MVIDINDSFCEVAILDDGLSADPMAYFFRYDGEKLLYCGSIPDLPDNFTMYGQGSVYANKRLNILHTWYAKSEWTYNDNGFLQEQVADFYDTYWAPKAENEQNIAMKNLILYRNPEISEDVMMIKKGQVLYLSY